jgi:hypothetical protein
VGLVIQPPQDLTTLRLHDSSLEANDIGAGLHQRYRPPKGKSNAGIRLVRHAVVPRFVLNCPVHANARIMRGRRLSERKQAVAQGLCPRTPRILRFGVSPDAGSVPADR